MQEAGALAIRAKRDGGYPARRIFRDKNHLRPGWDCHRDNSRRKQKIGLGVRVRRGRFSSLGDDNRWNAAHRFGFHRARPDNRPRTWDPLVKRSNTPRSCRIESPGGVLADQFDNWVLDSNRHYETEAVPHPHLPFHIFWRLHLIASKQNPQLCIVCIQKHLQNSKWQPQRPKPPATIIPPPTMLIHYRTFLKGITLDLVFSGT